METPYIAVYVIGVLREQVLQACSFGALHIPHS